MMLVFLYLLTFMTTLIRAQTTMDGPCPTNIKAAQNFDVLRFRDTWYDIQHYPVKFQDGICATTTISNKPNVSDASAFNFDVKMVEFKKTKMRIIHTKGTLLRDVKATDGMMTLAVKWSRNLNQTFQEYAGNYWVLATNYDSFALVWGCSQQINIVTNVTSNIQTAWILSRNTTLVAADKIKIDEILIANNISTTRLTPLEEHKCKSSSIQTLGYLVITFIALCNLEQVVILH